ncbi:hypothetical protein DE169_002445 [Clostridium acetobutylicum]|nr:hypothetical protein [Clostridium acetobutylicum]NRY57266.1 hypothetical protein [Clostridium acetobutylicum]NYC95149.1 hypothetical protein [Clostridium acetobutylicum]
MKKIVLILICIFTFSLVGCNKKVNDTRVAVHKKVKLDYPIHLSDKVLDNTSDIIEDDNFIYYSDKKGINKLNKKSGESKLILKQKNVNQLVLVEENIYFSTVDEKNFGIFCIDKNGSELSKIIDGKNMEYANQFRYFMIRDNNIYFQVTMSLYLFDMTSKKLKLLNNDAEQFKVNKGSVFYIDHGQRTFTIYKENIDDMKPQIILGKGVSEPKRDIYYGFAFIDDDLYFLKRIPNSSDNHYTTALFTYKNGNETIIMKNDNEVIGEDMVEYKGDLYFTTYSSDEKIKLLKYSAKDNTISQVDCRDSSKVDNYFVWNTVKIINGYLYYPTKDDKLRCVKLK